MFPEDWGKSKESNTIEKHSRIAAHQLERLSRKMHCTAHNTQARRKERLQCNATSVSFSPPERRVSVAVEIGVMAPGIKSPGIKRTREPGTAIVNDVDRGVGDVSHKNDRVKRVNSVSDICSLMTECTSNKNQDVRTSPPFMPVCKMSIIVNASYGLPNEHRP